MAIDLWVLEVKMGATENEDDGWNRVAVYEDRKEANERFHALSSRHEDAGVRLTKYVPFDDDRVLT